MGTNVLNGVKHFWKPYLIMTQHEFSQVGNFTFHKPNMNCKMEAMTMFQYFDWFIFNQFPWCKTKLGVNEPRLTSLVRNSFISFVPVEKLDRWSHHEFGKVWRRWNLFVGRNLSRLGAEDVGESKDD